MPCVHVFYTRYMHVKIMLVINIYIVCVCYIYIFQMFPYKDGFVCCCGFMWYFNVSNYHSEDESLNTYRI